MGSDQEYIYFMGIKNIYTLWRLKNIYTLWGRKQIDSASDPDRNIYTLWCRKYINTLWGRKRLYFFLNKILSKLLTIYFMGSKTLVCLLHTFRRIFVRSETLSFTCYILSDESRWDRKRFLLPITYFPTNLE